MDRANVQFTTTTAGIYEDATLANLVAALHSYMQRFGYQHTQLPAIESADLFLSKAGDAIIANLLTFERLGQQFALRPEFTALAAHRYARQYGSARPTIRWQFNGSVFLDDYSRRDGRYQYMSVGAELFGMQGTAYADAEIITMATSGVIEHAGLNAQVHIGHVGLLRAILAHYGLDKHTEQFLFGYIDALARQEITPDEIMAQFDGYISSGVDVLPPATPNEDAASVVANTQRMLDALLDANQRGTTMGGRSREDIVRRLVSKRERAAQRDIVRDAVAHLAEWLQLQGTPDTMLPQMQAQLPNAGTALTATFDEWRDALDIAAKMGVDTAQFVLSPGLVRDWNYYTGMTFSIMAGDGTTYGGGGRYDELVRLIGGTADVPAVGFAYDMDTIIAHSAGKTPPQPIRQLSLLAHPTNSNIGQITFWVNALQNQGVSVAVLDQPDSEATNAAQLTPTGLQYRDITYSTEQIQQLTNAIRETS